MAAIVNSLEQLKPSYIRQILAVSSNRDVISLAGGLPSMDSFPMSIIQEGLAMLSEKCEVFQYGETQGSLEFLEELRSRYKVPDTRDILVTSGSQQGIDLCARAFLNTKDRVVVENPSYLGALQVFSIAGAEMLTVDQQEDGPNLDQLTHYLANENVTMFYAVPDFHNPTGCCWSLEKRVAVAELCIKYNVLLLEDAPYRDLRFLGKQLPRVSSFCPENSIFLQSFSKLISPGLRVAMMVAPKTWINQIVKLKQATDLHTSSISQYLALKILRHPDFNAHLKQVTQSYQAKYQAMAEQLQTLPTNEYRFSEVEGGMFVWLTIPHCDTFKLAQTALSNGVAVVPSSEFYASDGSSYSALRLNFSNQSVATLNEAVTRLKLTLQDFI